MKGGIHSYSTHDKQLKFHSKSNQTSWTFLTRFVYTSFNTNDLKSAHTNILENRNFFEPVLSFSTGQNLRVISQIGFSFEVYRDTDRDFSPFIIETS